MSKTVIKNALLVNKGQVKSTDILIEDQWIVRIAPEINEKANHKEFNAEGLHVFPGVIDDQVHFREPGLTQKGDIFSESRAAVAGGVTSYMEMPNVVPQTLTQALLAEKYALGAAKSVANYSFYMGASNDNLEEVLKTNTQNVCGLKIFMGSSTGSMLVDDEKVLEKLFANVPVLIATHCEDEQTVRADLAKAIALYGEDIPFEKHPIIRSHEACYLSSSRAVALAKKHNTRLHILHISTARETELFRNDIPLEQKRITSEACIHHLWFTDADYADKGRWIKWNPAVKSEADRDGIWKALLDDRIDVIATDHAPHTIDEKQQGYLKAPSGGPLVQHTLLAMLDAHQQGKISLTDIARKMSHAVAVCFQIEKRGFVREGYYADMVAVNLREPYTVTADNILAKCGWSPFTGHTFGSSVKATWVSGALAYENGVVNDTVRGMRLTFKR